MGDFAIVLVVVLVLVLLWRGPKTIPKLGEALGRGVREARDAAETPDDDPARPRAEDDRRV